MEQESVDKALVAAAMTLAEERGWASVSVVESARRAGLPLTIVRQRFPSQTSILLCLGCLADENALDDTLSCHALSDDTQTDGDQRRDRLFDMIMRRLDVFQRYRKGVRAVLQALPFNPLQAALLGKATAESMCWIAEAAGLDTSGVAGMARVTALVALWTHVVRVWEKDENADMESTMAALEQALDKGVQWGLLSGGFSEVFSQASVQKKATQETQEDDLQKEVF